MKNIKSIKEKIFSKFSISDELSLLIIFIFIVSIAAIFLPRFWSFDNIITVTRQFSIIGLVAMGEAMVLITGCFDLSVGSIASLAGMLAAHLMVELSWPVWLSVIIGILVGVTAGLINGILITKVKISALIGTLATSWIFMGIVLVMSKGWPINEMPEQFWFLGQGRILNIPMPIILMVIIAIILTIFLNKTIYGRFTYAVGGNKEASILAGLNADRVMILAFIICDTLAALAGIVLASRMASAQVNNGVNWPLPAIAAAVIGGVGLSGGKGKIWGVIVGVALLGIIDNILLMFHVSSYWQTLVSGVIVLIAVTIDALRKRREFFRKTQIIKQK